MIDWERVAELQEEVGAEDFQDVVALFCEEVEDALARLGSDHQKDAETLHFLKGSALNLGFETMAALCRQAEQSGQPAGPGCRDGIKNAYESAKVEIISAF